MHLFSFHQQDSPALRLHELSASDAVHIITSILGHIPGCLSTSRADRLPKTDDGRRDMEAVQRIGKT